MSKLAFFPLCPSTSTHAKVGHRPQLCHPERSRGTCCAPFPLTTPYSSVHPSPLMPRWATARNFVIPSVAEGPAVCLDGKTEPGGDSPTAHSLLPKVEPQVPPLRYALSKNTSTKGPLNRRSLGFARDDKVEGSAPMESSCCMRAVFHLLGWADGP